MNHRDLVFFLAGAGMILGLWLTVQVVSAPSDARGVDPAPGGERATAGRSDAEQTYDAIISSLQSDLHECLGARGQGPAARASRAAANDDSWLGEMLRERHLAPYAEQFLDTYGRFIDLDNDKVVFGLLSRLINLRSEDVPEGMTTREVVSKLMDLYGHNLVSHATDHPRDVRGAVPLDFAETAGGAISNVISADSEAVHAYFPTEKVDSGRVIYKCYQKDKPETAFFRYFDVNKKSRYNSIAVIRPDGWNPGEYRAEMYSSNIRDNYTLLSDGEFTVR